MKKINLSLPQLLNLEGGEKVIKVKYIKDCTNLLGHMVYSYLKVLDFEGLLPKGYLTRVNNKQIKFQTAYDMCLKAGQLSIYRVETCTYEDIEIFALVQKANVCPTTKKLCNSTIYMLPECADCLGIE